MYSRTVNAMNQQAREYLHDTVDENLLGYPIKSVSALYDHDQTDMEKLRHLRNHQKPIPKSRAQVHLPPKQKSLMPSFPPA